ncbi:hypothetical protein [Ruegeria hyattellae]|uniref:hypothetical protein n=1 Tax=Ruegeria hyattellae TaxID=3233337 RepID=UPI00355BA3E0
MSDFFTRLVARHQGREIGLSPRLPGIFEPEGQWGEGFVENNKESVTQQPKHVPQQVPEEARSVQPKPTSGQWEKKSLNPKNETRTELRDTKEIERETRIERDDEVPNVTTEHHTHETHVVHTDHHLETHRLTERVERQTTRPEPHRPDTKAEPPVTPETSRLRVEPTPTPPPRPLPTQQIARLHEMSAPMPAPAPKPVQSERRIEVQIGHLEIRQSPAPKPKARKQAASAHPGPDLKTYLGGRRE